MRILVATIFMALLTITTVAKADPYDGTGVYSVATPNCVPAVQALFWYDVGFIFATRRLRDEEEKFLLKEGATPACWLGKASKHLGIKHRLLYLPEESRRIQRWFASRS